MTVRIYAANQRPKRMPKYVKVGARLYVYDTPVIVTGIRGPLVLIQSAPHSGLPSQVHYTYLRREFSAGEAAK